MLKYRKGPCPPKCPDRDVYCKKTCPRWAEHEAESERINELRRKARPIRDGNARRSIHYKWDCGTIRRFK